MSSRRIAGITIEIDGNTTKLNDALKSVDKQLASTQSQLKDVEKLLKMDPRNTELLAQKQRLLTDAIEGSKDRLKELEKAQAELAKKDASPELQKQQDALQREIVETQQKIKGFEDELGKIPNKAQIAFDKIGEGLQKTGEKMSEAGENMTKKVTAPIMAVGAASVAAFSEVDDAMDTVLKKTGATGEELEGMQKTVESLATTIPTTFEEAGNAVGEVNTRFGVTGEELETLSGQFIKFAQLNNTTVSDSVDRTQKLMAAFGIETKDAGKVLDTLNRTAQKSGISVDKLSDLMTANAASLQQMGMSAADAAEFLGGVEKSGADVTVVMRGLQNANKKAAKEGKSMNQVLREFSNVMKGNGSDAEKLQAAIDLFGNKAGQSIYNAAKQGTLSLEEMGASLDSFAGSVEKTFSGTIDGVDNWKMAMNEVKLLGADIGGILSEFAGPVLKKVRDALQEAVGWWRNLNEHQQETIIKVAGIIAAIGPAVTVIGKLTSAVGLLSQGLGILAAHPVAAAIIGLTTAATAGVVAIKKHTDALKAEYEASLGLTEEVKENTQAIEEQAEKYAEMKRNRDEQAGAIDAEYGHLQELATEYDSYLDQNGKVIEKYKERADFIETTLAEALGLEREDIQKIVQENGNLSKSIDEIIQKRKAEAMLNAFNEEYTQAIVEREKAVENLARAEADRDKMMKIREGMETRHKELVDLITKSEDANEAQIHAWAEELGDLESAMADADAAIATQQGYVDQARETYENYETTIANYEGMSAAVIAGDTTAIGKSLAMYRQDFKTTETATAESLKKQYDTLNREYKNMETAVKNGDKSITQTDLAEKKYWRDQALKEYSKATQDARDGAKKTVDGYSQNIRNGRKSASDAASYVGGGVTSALSNTASKAEDYGYNIAQGLASGIRRNSSLATYAAQNMADAVANKLRGAFQINSPSKLTEYFGQMLDEGLAVGMDSGVAVRAAQNLARDVAQPFESQQNRDTIANSAPMNQATMVEAFQTALSRMKVEMDDREMGSFVEKTVVKAVYA